MASLNKFIELLEYYCDDASVGYDQSNRWSVFDGGECDCSSLVITCLKQSGFDVGNATYTGNMSSELCARGWQRLTPTIADAKPGDILLNDANHVAAVVSGNGWSARIAQASIDENGNISGGASGDQSGWETNVTRIYNYPPTQLVEGSHDAPISAFHPFRHINYLTKANLVHFYLFQESVKAFPLFSENYYHYKML